MIPASSVFDALAWEPIEAQALAQIVEGGTVTGLEPIDYPLTDGLVFYLTGRNGRQLALEIGADPAANPEDNPFYINIAVIPQEAQQHDNP